MKISSPLLSARPGRRGGRRRRAPASLGAHARPTARPRTIATPPRPRRLGSAARPRVPPPVPSLPPPPAFGTTSAPRPLPKPPPAAAAALEFPGRTVLYVREVAGRLEVTEQHVCDLIAEGLLFAINVGGRGGSRKSWRIPVAAFQTFLRQRSSLC